MQRRMAEARRTRMLHAAMGCWQRLVARRRAKSTAAALARSRELLRCMQGWRAWATGTAPAPAAWAEEDDLLLSMPGRPCAALGSNKAEVPLAGAREACWSDAEEQAVCRRMQARHNCPHALPEPAESTLN